MKRYVPSAIFPNIRHSVVISKHCASRMKSRAGLNTKQKRVSFLRSAAKNSIQLADIPNIPEFKSFIHYMRNSKFKVMDKNPSCRLYLFRDYFLIISFVGVMVTIINVDKGYAGIYQQIVDYISDDEDIVEFTEN